MAVFSRHAISASTGLTAGAAPWLFSCFSIGRSLLLVQLLLPSARMTCIVMVRMAPNEVAHHQAGKSRHFYNYSSSRCLECPFPSCYCLLAWAFRPTVFFSLACQTLGIPFRRLLRHHTGTPEPSLLPARLCCAIVVITDSPDPHQFCAFDKRRVCPFPILC